MPSFIFFFNLSIPNNLSTPIDTLKRRRSEFKGRITRLRAYLLTTDEAHDFNKTEVKLEELIETFRAVEVIHEELMERDSAASDAHTMELGNIEEDCHDVIAKARKLIRRVREIERTPTLANFNDAASSQETFSLIQNPAPSPQVDANVSANPPITTLDRAGTSHSSLTAFAAEDLVNLK